MNPSRFRPPAGMALLTFAGIPAAQCADAHPKRHRQQPLNIVLIHLDDMGYGDLTATGATGYRTPNIDRLCAEGMRFTNYYSAQGRQQRLARRASDGMLPQPHRIRRGARPRNRKSDSTPTRRPWPRILKKPVTQPPSSANGTWDAVPGLCPSTTVSTNTSGCPTPTTCGPTIRRLRPIRRCRCTKGARSSTRRSRPPDQAQLTTWYTEHAVDFITRRSEGRSSSTWPTPCRMCRSSSRTSSKAKASRDYTAT